MSNRENLRRIAALSLVIAFGMSGAAGLAEEEPTVVNTSDNDDVGIADTVAVQSDSSDLVVDGSSNNLSNFVSIDSTALVNDAASIPIDVESESVYTLYNPSNNINCEEDGTFFVRISSADGSSLKGLSNIIAHISSEKFPAKFSGEHISVSSSDSSEAYIYIPFNVSPNYGSDCEATITFTAEFADGRIADFGNQALNLRYVNDTSDVIDFDTTNIHPEDSGLGGFDWNSTVLPGDTITFPSVKLNYNGNVHTLEFHNNAKNHVFITNSDDFTSITFPFGGCGHYGIFAELPSSTWGTTNLKTAIEIFFECSHEELDISGFDNITLYKSDDVNASSSGQFAGLIKVVRANGKSADDIDLDLYSRNEFPAKLEFTKIKSEGNVAYFSLKFSDVSSTQSENISIQPNIHAKIFNTHDGIDFADWDDYWNGFETDYTLNINYIGSTPETTFSVDTNNFVEEFIKDDSNPNSNPIPYYVWKGSEIKAGDTITFDAFHASIDGEDVNVSYLPVDNSLRQYIDTSESGNVSITFPESGTFIITASPDWNINDNLLTSHNNKNAVLRFSVAEAELEEKVNLTTESTADFTSENERFTFAGNFEETEDDEGNCKFTAAFKPFWNFKLGEEELTPELFDADGEKVAFDKGENGNWTLSFEPGKTYTYTVKALKDAESGNVYDTPAVTLVFEVPEHNEPVEELPTVEYDEDVWSKYFTRSKDDDNTFIYNDKLEFTAGSSCTARFEPFYSFKLDSLAESKHLLSSLKITNFECANEPDDILALTFSEEGDYDVVVASALYNEVVGADGEKTYEHIKDYDKPAVTLKFHVTKRTPAPVNPDPVFPVDPVTPAPTATPTATPAPTETPAPTDAPTDAPTSEPTAAPDVEMQVSAGGKRLNVRSGAGIGNSIIARLNDGSKVTVLLVEGDWSYIRATVNGNVIEGYVSSQYLKEISTVEPTEPANARVSTSGSALRLRASASLNAPIIARMPNGSSLKVLETVNGWCRVQFTAANGTVHEGWASSQYITVIA